MQDRQLYATILGLCSPWEVERVELNEQDEAVHIYLEHPHGVGWPCPECGATCQLYDHLPERTWRHLDTCQYRTILHARPPRSDCADHGVKAVALPWAEAGSRFTALFERLTIDWLHGASQQAVADILGLSWDEIHGIMERAVARGLARRQAEPLTYLGVDEKAFRKGQRYVTLVNDLDGHRVLYVAEGRTQASLDGFWPTLTSDQRAGIRAVAMDMWDPYVNSVTEHLNAPEKIVFDKFHIAGHLGDAVDKVRRWENKELRQHGDNRLVGTKYDWLRHPANFAQSDWCSFQTLRKSDLKTARAWAIKEAAMRMFLFQQRWRANLHFRRWYYWATHSRLAPVIDVARMLKRRLANVLTYFTHPITNSRSETINSKIQWVKYTARGFRNRKNFATAIYFHCGALDMTPLPT